MKKTIITSVLLFVMLLLGNNSVGTMATALTDSPATVAATRKIIEPYVHLKGRNTIFVTEANRKKYEDTMRRYMPILKKKGYSYDDMLLAFRMAEAVGKNSRFITTDVGPYDPKKTESDTAGLFNDQEYAIYIGGNDTVGYKVAIAFQGTDAGSAGDIASNADTGSAENKHMGYWKRANEIWEKDIRISGINLQSLARMAVDGQVHFFLAGHSMGGAIAQDLAMILMDNGVPAKQITGYTFNCALSIRQSNPYYKKDLRFFNIANQSDNVSSGDLAVGLQGAGRRIGYDIPLFDPMHRGNGSSGIPNDQHGLDYLMSTLEFNQSLLLPPKNADTGITIQYNDNHDSGKVKVKWDADIFSYPAIIYNNDLALVAAGLNAAIGNGTIKNTLISMGFNSHNYKASSLTRNEHAYAIAHQSMIINKEKVNVVAIVMRGTKGIRESIGDFFTSAPEKGNENFYGYSVHTYFLEYMQLVWDAFSDYADRHPEIKSGRTKFLVCGHSLGGAAANLLAAKMIMADSKKQEWKEAGWKDPPTQDDIYAYTFGALNSFDHDYEEAHMSEFLNIFNIFNYHDTFGPHGEGVTDLKLRPSSGWLSSEWKYGTVLEFQKDYEKVFIDAKDKAYRNHDMPCYIHAVKEGIVLDAMGFDHLSYPPYYLRSPVTAIVKYRFTMPEQFASYDEILQGYGQIIRIGNNALLESRMGLFKESAASSMLSLDDPYGIEYAIYDINHDGTDELIIKSSSLDFSDNPVILAIYSQVDGVPFPLWLIDTSNFNRKVVTIDASGNLIVEHSGGGIGYDRIYKIDMRSKRIVFVKGFETKRVSVNCFSYYWPQLIVRETSVTLVPKDQEVKPYRGDPISSREEDSISFFPIPVYVEPVPTSQSTGVNMLNSITKAERKVANIFFSNFSESGFNSFNIDSYDETKLIEFALRNIYINRISDFLSAGDNYLRISPDRIDQTLTRFFGVTAKNIDQYSIPDQEYPQYFKDGYIYYPDWNSFSDGEADKWSHVTRLTDNGDGTLTADVDAYFGYVDPSDFYGDKGDWPDEEVHQDYASTAVIKPYRYNNRDTYQLIAMYPQGSLPPTAQPVTEPPVIADIGPVDYSKIAGESFTSYSVYAEPYFTTTLILHEDGSFDGKYSGVTHYFDTGEHDEDYRTTSFRGKFSPLTKISDWEYSMQIDLIEYDRPDDINKDRLRTIGITSGDQFRLYLHGAKTANLPQRFVSYLENQNFDEYVPDYLPGYALYNLSDEGAAFSQGKDNLNEAEDSVPSVSFDDVESSHMGEMYVINCQEYVSLRRYPSTEAERICTVPLFAAVTPYTLSDDGRFWEVYYDGEYGYISADYLSTEISDHRQPASNTQPESLNTPRVTMPPFSFDIERYVDGGDFAVYVSFTPERMELDNSTLVGSYQFLGVYSDGVVIYTDASLNESSVIQGIGQFDEDGYTKYVDGMAIAAPLGYYGFYKGSNNVDYYGALSSENGQLSITLQTTDKSGWTKKYMCSPDTDGNLAYSCTTILNGTTSESDGMLVYAGSSTDGHMKYIDGFTLAFTGDLLEGTNYSEGFSYEGDGEHSDGMDEYYEDPLFVIATGDVKLRLGPGIEYNDVGTLYQGDYLQYLDEISTDDRGIDWYMAAYNIDEVVWISSMHSEIGY